MAYYNFFERMGVYTKYWPCAVFRSRASRQSTLLSKDMYYFASPRRVQEINSFVTTQTPESKPFRVCYSSYWSLSPGDAVTAE